MGRSSQDNGTQSGSCTISSEYPINDSPSKPIEPSHFSHSPDKIRGHKSYVETQIPNPSPQAVSPVKQVYETAILENVGF